MPISILLKILLSVLNKIFLSFSTFKSKILLNLIQLLLLIRKSIVVHTTKPISKSKRHSVSMVRHWIHKLMLYLVAGMLRSTLKESLKLSTQKTQLRFKSALLAFLSQTKTCFLFLTLILLFNGLAFKTKDFETGWPWMQMKR